MYFLHSTITLLLVIAHVQCGTLRQYGPDWLIPKPAPHIDSKRITAKSVFIAPSLQAQNVRCATGLRDDGSGRCVKLVHVNQAAQLDFLLQRLNAMYGAPMLNHSDKQPLQVAVEIPVELVDGNDTLIPLKGEEMYNEAILPEGDVSVDLLEGTLNQPDSTEEPTDENATKGNQNEDVKMQSEIDVEPPDGGGHPQGTYEESGLPDFRNESEDNITEDPMFKPNKEWFQVDEEPVVTLTSIDDDDDDEDYVENITVDSGNVTKSEEDELPDTLLSIHSEDAGGMANIMKNTSNVVKKETPLGDSSVPVSSESTSYQTFTENYSSGTANDTGVQSMHIVKNKQGQVSHTTNNSANMLPSEFAVNGEKLQSTEDESINEVHTKSTDTANVTSSQLNDTNTTEESFPVTSSILESTSESSTTEVSTTQMPKRQQSTINLTSQETTTREPTTQVVTTGMPTFATNEAYGEPTEPNVNINVDEHDWEDSGEQVENEKQDTNEEDYEYPIQDVDVEAEGPEDYISEVADSGNAAIDLHTGDKRYPEIVPEVSAYEGLVLSVNDSVKINSSESTVDGVSDDERFSEETYGSELEENNYDVNRNVSLNSTKTIEKTELENGINVPSSNGTNFDNPTSVSQTIETGVEKLSENLSNVGGQSVVKQEPSEVLKADSTVHKVEIQPYEFSEIVHSVSQQMQHQPVITPQHSVHVVYPQPIIQVMNVKLEPHTYPINVANQHKPNIEHKDTFDPNSPHVQFHNLNPIPNPLQHHNFNPLPQMPLVEKAPDIPAKYGGYPYPPLAPHSEVPRPNPFPQHRPYPHHNPNPQQNPHQTRYPQDIPNPNGQGGFVRFPSEPVQTHRPHAQTHGEEVNTVRFPQEDTRNNDKYSRWGNWRFDESRRQRPEQSYWAGAQETQYPQGTNRRNYWVDNRPNRRRLQPSFY